MGSHVNELTRFEGLADLSAEKLQQQETIFKSILALPITWVTYAQIIDRERSYVDPLRKLPTKVADVSDHLNPSDGATHYHEEFWKVFTA